MRFLTVFAITSTLASAALAQIASTQVEAIGLDGRGQATGQAAPAPATITPSMSAPARASATATVNVQAPSPSVAIPGSQGNATILPVAPTPITPVDEIGFDAKVKRDPNGKIIGDKTPAATAPVPQALRNDSNLSGDSGPGAKRSAGFHSDSVKPASAADASSANTAPTPPADISNAQLLEALKKSKAAPTTAISVQGGQQMQH